jgi:hypothetical protein
MKIRASGLRTFEFLAFSLLALIFFSASAARAQNVGSLRGQITDPSGAAVPGATVDVVGDATGVSRSATTDNVGTYSFADLPPEIYTLRVSHAGFKGMVREKVEVNVSNPSTVNIVLALGAASERVVVESASAPLINTADATVGNPFDDHQVDDLPFLARNVVNLLSLQPGVVFTGATDTDTLALGSTAKMDNREGVVNGVRGNESNITVDGVDSNNWLNQGAFSSALPLTLDSVQEVRVITSNANATDGTASGGQVALVTKSGSNAFHGNARWYYRSSGTTANAFFNNADGIARPQLQRNIGGGSLGGPIRKNRLFFFLDNEERRDRSSEAQGPRSVPTQSLKDGALIYSCLVPSQCPGGTVQGLTGSHIVPAGAFGLTPADVQSVDPAGLGVNQAMVNYMSLFPAGNVPSAGLDGGLSFTGYRFNAPADLFSNTYIGRIDMNLTADGRHTLFVRAALIGASDDLSPEQFPGQISAQGLENNSRGISAQYSAQFNSMLVNTLRYGFTRTGVALSGTTGPSFGVRDYDSNLAFDRPNDTQIPVHEFNDNLSWAHGKHSLSFGGIVRYLEIHRQDASSAYPAFSANIGTCLSNCNDAYANVTSVLNDPTPVSSQYFTEPFLELTGAITYATDTLYSNPHTQTFLPPGSIERRTTAEHDFETYAQDSWRVRSNLTVTAGLRYEYETPPWEVNGYEVAPTINLTDWFFDRIKNMDAGISSSASPLITYALAGRANGKPSWYNPDRNNFAPRLAVAYSPDFQGGLLGKIFGGPGQSSVRAGFGIYYDRIGEPIALDSDHFASPGVSTVVANSGGPFSLGTAPRFSGTCSNAGCTGLPSISQFVTLPTSAAVPVTPAVDSGAFGFFVDPHLRTPYSMDFTFGVQRSLGKGTSIEVGYVGTMGRSLLAKSDYAQYLNLKDPASGQTLWQAETAIANIVGPNYASPNVNPNSVAALSTIAPIPFFQHEMPNMPNSVAALTGNPALASLTPTQAYYAFQFAVEPGGPSWACANYAADVYEKYGLPSPWSKQLDPTGNGHVIYSQQFNSLGGWTNWANSNYNSLQASVHHTAGHAVFTASYVFSKSIDNDSSAENADVGGNYGSLVGLIQNPFSLRQNRSVSDFNLRHNFNGNVVYRLPFGHGETFGNDSGRLLNAVIGGWELTGLVRWRSGFPLSPGNGFYYPTNYQRNGPGTLIHPVTSHVTRNGPGGVPNLFSDPAAILADDFEYTLPGLSGSRNAITGPAYFSTDAGIYKTFLMPWSDRQRLQFRATAFNLFNNVNFSPGAPFAPGNESGWNGLTLDPTSPSTFGQFSQTDGPRGGAREMEFAVRYEF